MTDRAEEPLVVVEEAFPVRGAAVQLTPRITVHNDAPRAPFPVRLRLPDGRERTAMAASTWPTSAGRTARSRWCACSA